jgi:uncharacterized membrane protein (UPF0127 family)
MIERRHLLRPAVAVLAAALVACGDDPPKAEARDDTLDLPRGVLVVQTDEGQVEIHVEIAGTPLARVIGLMGRRTLAANSGMVFLEDEPTQGFFWMKDTLIPLSIAFWDQDGRIFQILDMEPCPAEPCPHYRPEADWVGAVEVNQGFFGEHGIRVGDRVHLER